MSDRRWPVAAPEIAAFKSSWMTAFVEGGRSYESGQSTTQKVAANPSKAALAADCAKLSASETNQRVDTG
jgi:hypothetical protein